jgi:hypothetical protein
MISNGTCSCLGERTGIHAIYIFGQLKIIGEMKDKVEGKCNEKHKREVG